MSLEKRYYHVQLKYSEPQKTSVGTTFDSIKTEQECDLSEEDATALGKQYSEGCIFFKGKWIDTSSIKEIEIRETQAKSRMYYGSVFQASAAEVVTRRFIKSQPKRGAAVTQPSAQPTRRETSIQSKDVFIVHGNNHTPMKELKALLYELGLNPIVLHEQPSGSRTIIEKLEKYSNVGYAFVILTPDDIGGLFEELTKQTLTIDDLFNQFLKRRARQNVVLEFGYFMGLLGRNRVCCLHTGNIELPSDMHGIVYAPFNKSIDEARLRIMKELKDAGYDIKI